MRARCCLILLFAASSAASAASTPPDCYLTRGCPGVQKIREEVRPGVFTNSRSECRAEIPGEKVTRLHKDGTADSGPTRPGTPNSFYPGDPCGKVWVDRNYGIRGRRNWVMDEMPENLLSDVLVPIPCGYLRLGSACQI